MKNFQPTIVALILFLAVLVYCLFHRYDLQKATESGSVVVDHLTGTCYTMFGEKVRHP